MVLTIFFTSILFAGKREAYLEKSIIDTKAKPTKENIISLMDNIIGNLRHPKLISEQEPQLTDYALQELVKIPNHAEYFADQVRRKQAEVAHIPIGPYGDRINYNKIRTHNILLTLSRLPSAETVRVLGEFLSDDKDWPKGPVKGDYYANNGLAMLAFKGIGLRNPAENNPSDDSSSCLSKWQEWYSKVKAGELTFSFKGQPDEYRFQPDGTWITIPLVNPPADAVPLFKRMIASKLVDTVPVPTPVIPKRSSWIYTGIGLLLLIVTLVTRTIFRRQKI